jgi:hypothetical protein
LTRKLVWTDWIKMSHISHRRLIPVVTLIAALIGCTSSAQSSYNVVKYNTAGSADFVNPNLDVAYLEAWVAVDERTPVVLEIP